MNSGSLGLRWFLTSTIGLNHTAADDEGTAVGRRGDPHFRAARPRDGTQPTNRADRNKKRIALVLYHLSPSYAYFVSEFFLSQVKLQSKSTEITTDVTDE